MTSTVMASTSPRSISVSQACSAPGTLPTESSAHRFWLAGKRISSLLASTELTALARELRQGHRWELASSVVLGLVLVNLMDRNGGVDNGRLNRLLLDDGLDVLVHVVVDMLACNSLALGGGTLCLAEFAGVLELGLLGCEAGLGVFVGAVLDVAVLDAGHLVGVLFGEDLAVLDGLDGGVVVVLVDFTVDGFGLLVDLGASYVLVLDGGVDSLVHGSFMLSILGKEVSDRCLCFIHCDGVVREVSCV